MIPRKDVEDIFKRAVQAPSGDNAQPWRLEMQGDAVNIYNIAGKDYSPYNYLERGSFLAHGALIENAVIASSAAGYGAKVALFPDGGESLVARVEFSPASGSVAVDPLAGFIEERCTNRKPYEKVPLAAEQKRQLLDSAASADFGAFKFLEDTKEIAAFAKTVSLSDRLIFEDRKIHDAIFHSIRWTREEEKERPGLYIETLELPPPAKMLFKLLRNWSTLTFLNRIKISYFIATQSAKNYASSSAIGMFTIPNAQPESMVKAGRVFERFWLTATSLGVALQPVTALAYLDERVKAHEPGGLSEKHQEEILKAQGDIRTLFGNPNGVVAMMFRVGYGDIPSARSVKSPLEIKP